MPKVRYRAVPKIGDSHASPIQPTATLTRRLRSRACRVTPIASAKPSRASTSDRIRAVDWTQRVIAFSKVRLSGFASRGAGST